MTNSDSSALTVESPSDSLLNEIAQGIAPSLDHSEVPSGRTESRAETQDIVLRLRDTPNWMRESFGHWKSCTKEYDRAPFDAAVEIERLRAINAELLEALKVAEQFMSIASDWNIDEAEINGEMRSTYDWLEVVQAAIAKATGEQS